MLILMCHLRKEHKWLKVKIPGLRFGVYVKIVIPEKEAWLKLTTEVIRLCLEASYRLDPPGNKKEKSLFYENMRKLIEKEIPNAGNLITNHLMGVFAIVGLVPLWFGHEHSVDPSSKSMTYLVSDHGLKKG